MRPAEPGVPHRRLVLAGALDFVLVVQQSQVDPDLGHFRMDVRPVELLERALAHVPFRVEQAVDLLFAQVLDLDPRDSPLVCDVEHLEDAAHGHMPVLAIDLLAMPWSRSSMMSFTFIILAMWFLLPSIGCMASRFYGRDKETRKRRNG